MIEIYNDYKSVKKQDAKITDNTPTEHGRKSERTIYGRLVQYGTGARLSKIMIEFHYLTVDEKNILERFWLKKESVNIKKHNGDELVNHAITGTSFPLKVNYEADGTEFYSGSLTFER